MSITSIVLSVPLYVGSRLEPYLNFSSNNHKSGKEPVAQMSDILVCRDTRAPASRYFLGFIISYNQICMQLEKSSKIEVTIKYEYFHLCFTEWPTTLLEALFNSSYRWS